MSNPPVDSASVGLMLGVAHLTKDALTDIVKRLVGPTADRAGQALADTFFKKRAVRAIAVVEDAAGMLQDAGIEPQAVPGRILMPVLEHCSWEEDEELQRKWAALLANAASPAMASRIIPAFAEILRQLTPLHAAVLQWMFNMKEDVSTGIPHWPDVSRREVEARFQLEPRNYALLVTDLERLQVIEPRRDLKLPFPDDGTVEADEVWPLIIAAWNDRVRYDSIGLTSLGLQFIEACTPPARKS